MVDQCLQLFGKPGAIWLDLACQRDGARADDWFHAVLKYGSMRAVLHASALTARPAPRFTIHGTAGSYIKHGLDTQEAALCAGKIPLDDDWAPDPSEGVLTLATEQGLVDRQHPTAAGAYARYYAAMRDAIRFAAPVPVAARSACEVVGVIEAGIQSAAYGRTIDL